MRHTFQTTESVDLILLKYRMDGWTVGRTDGQTNLWSCIALDLKKLRTLQVQSRGMVIMDDFDDRIRNICVICNVCYVDMWTRN